MNSTKLALAALATAAAVSVPQAYAQGTPSDPCKTVVKKHHKKTEPPCGDVRKKIDDLQAEIDALKQQVANAPQPQPESDPIASPLAKQAQQTADGAQSAANAAQQTANGAVTTANDAQAKAVDANKKVDALHDEVYSPAAIHYKGLNITPGGFAAFEGVWRQHSVNSDINTPLNSIPFPSAQEGHVSELNFSGRQSRLSVLAEAKPGNGTLTAYYEMDWLGTGTSSNNNQSNSYVLRQRQLWGRYMTNSGFGVTGGQMWSLVTEDRKGTDNRTEIQPQTIDPQYTVGYNWTRQPGIKIQQRFGDLTKQAFTVAVAAEQAQITNFTVASSVSAAIPADYFFAGIGQNGGLYNAAGNIGNGNTAGTGAITTYANNVAPDILVKAAYDAPIFHLEIGGIARFLRDYYYPIVNTAGTAAAPVYTYGSSYVSNTKTAGGAFGAARVYLMNKKLEVAVQAMAGTGVGRYGSAQLADATLRPDESLAPIKNYHGLASIEYHVTPKFDVFFYYGDEYAQRTVYTTNLGDHIGYGTRELSNAGCYNLPTPAGGSNGSAGSIAATGACASPTRNIMEAMGGFQWRPITSAKYGRLQYSATYSYVQRNLWSGVASTTTPSGPRATEPMIHVQMRYYIP